MKLSQVVVLGVVSAFVAGTTALAQDTKAAAPEQKAEKASCKGKDKKACNAKAKKHHKGDKTSCKGKNGCEGKDAAPEAAPEAK